MQQELARRPDMRSLSCGCLYMLFLSVKTVVPTSPDAILRHVRGIP